MYKTLLFPKPKNQSVSAIDPNPTVSLAPEVSLPKVYDKLFKRLFLIDSGVCANFLPVSDNAEINEIQSQFVDASGNPVKMFWKH